MAEADIRLPDGRTATIRVPEGMPDEQIQAQVQQMFEAGAFDQPVATPAQPEDFDPNAGVGSLEAGLIAAGRGLTTVARGLGLAEPEDPIVTRQFERLAEERPIATTVGEVAGEAAPFLLPGGAIVRGASTAARVAGAGALGATEAGVITRGHGADIGQQFMAAGLGGSVAGALELALPVIGRIGSKIVRRVIGKAPDGAVVDAAGNPSQELLDALQQSGQSFDDIVREAREELTEKAVDPKQAARKAFLETQGLDPTRAQITRNAADFQAQQEAAKTSGRVRDALERQEAVLTTRFDDAILKTGGQSDAPTSTVFDALTEKASTLDQEIGDLYSLARQRAPADKNIRFNSTINTLLKLSPADRRAGGNIRAIIGDLQSRGIIDDKFKPIGQVSVETAEEVRKFMNTLHDPANPFANSLLRKIKDSLDDDVFKAAGDDVFEQARKAKADFEKGLSRAKISKFDSRKQNLVRDILENKIDPDQLTDKVIFGRSWRADDLRQLKDYISTDEAGKKAFNDLRAEVMQKIKERSFIGPADAEGFQALSRDKLQRVLQSIGQNKINVLFNPDEQKFLKNMLEVAKLREPVRGTALGRGPSAQAIGQLESAIRQNPILRVLLDSVSFDAQGRAVLKSRPAPISQPIEGSALRGAAVAGSVAALPQEQQ